MSIVTSNKDSNKSKGNRFKLLCSSCSGETNHEVLQSVETRGDETCGEQGWSINWADWYYIVECLGCDTISFVHRNYFSEADDCFPGGHDGVSTNVYPFRSENSRATKKTHNLSPRLRRIYNEIIDTFNRTSFTLCAAGLRAMLEGICADKGVTRGRVEVNAKGGGKKFINKTNIEGKIEGMVQGWSSCKRTCRNTSRTEVSW